MLALGRAYMGVGRLKEGIETYKKALDIDSRQPEALSTLGVVLLQSGHFDVALAAFDRVLETDSGYPMALWVNEGLGRFHPSVERERSLFVRQGFAAAAPFYDALTRLFSFGLDSRWRRCCLDLCQLRSGESLLDVATGTGELAVHGAKKVKRTGRVVGLDVCAEMLFEARRKIQDLGGPITWVQGKADSLPFRDEQFDCVTVGFSLRHVDNLGTTLKEMARVLKPGGRLGIVEFTQPEGTIARFLLLSYLSLVVPPLVVLLSRSWLTFRLARYLPATIKRFVSTEALCRSLEAAGLDSVTVGRYMAGMVSVCVGGKATAIARQRDAAVR